MKYFLFILNSAIDDLKKSKIRTTLASLGILIGILSVILLLALGLGLKKYINDQFESLGANLVMILPGKGLQGGLRPGGGMLGGAQFDEKDVVTLKKIKYVTTIAPFVMTYSEIAAEGKAEIYEIIGSSADVFPVMNLEVDLGSFFDKADVEKRSKVAVLGSKPAEKIFGTAKNAVGKNVKIDDQTFYVIGVCKSKGGGFIGGIDDHAYIPYKTAFNFVPRKKFFAFYLKAENDSFVAQVKEEAKEVLLKRYNEDDFSVSDQKETMDALSTIFDMINFVLVGIAAISLVVGGVGIMNIMYVSVTEKIKEIGIRRAVGATAFDILFQFIAEAAILSAFGGLFAIIIAYGLIYFIQNFFPAYIDLNSVLLALGVSSFIGVIFGALPAKKAADLSPIEAIRYE